MSVKAMHSPRLFTLGYTTEVSDKEVVSTWLRLEKAD